MKKFSFKKLLHSCFYHTKGHKYINGTQGVISLFLALLMVPFAMVAGVLINSARVDSAVAIFDEELSNASNSVLGTYDSFLRKRFGLLAMQQSVEGDLTAESVSEFLSATFKEYMEQNKLALSNTYFDVESKSKGEFPLADRNVLYAEIEEYSKYSVPAQFVEDTFSIDGIIKTIDNWIPGSDYFALIGTFGTAADSIVTLSEDIDLLAAAADREADANKTYSDAYNDFEKAVSDYVDLNDKKNTELQNLQNTVNSEQSSVDSYASQQASYNQEIDDLYNQLNDTILTEEERSSINSQISDLEGKRDSARQNKESHQQALNGASTKYTEAETSYNNQLEAQKTTVTQKKEAYSSAIADYSSKVNDALNKLDNVIKAKEGVVSAADGVVNEAISTGVDQAQKDNSDRIKQLEKDKDDTDDEETKNNLENEKKDLVDENRNIGNIKTVYDACRDGYSEAMDAGKDAFSDARKELYKAVKEALDNLKTKVDAYSTDSITVKISKSDYYYTVAGLLTSDEVNEAGDAIGKDIAKESIWGVIKGVFAFITALFKISLIYNPELNAVIDKGYYDNVGGLPSEKDRSAYPLCEGEAGEDGEKSDAELSQEYKDLYGSFVTEDNNIELDYDLLDKFESIVKNISTIRSAVSDITKIYKLLEIGKNLQKIWTAAEAIITDLKDICSYIKKALQPENIGKKLLLAGYIGYMTSDRTTVDGKALTGTSFNERGQESDMAETVINIDGFSALINLITKAIGGGSDKCFVGAEKEYILYGTKSEIVNQGISFAVIYMIRLVCDIIPVFTDVEVDSIAAACTIGAPVVYLVYIIVEPLVDTVIMVNGGDIDLVKNYCFLTPSHIGQMISKFTKISLSSDELTEAKTNLVSCFDTPEYAEKYAELSDAYSKKAEDKYFTIDYSKTLLILMAVMESPKRLLDRMSDIIDMEANENIANSLSEAPEKPVFDLDYSFTSLRTAARFKTNEFMPIANKNGINIKKRIIYRGYL